jgi:DNA invertase Pin-like site-specific DNA recombinase
LRKFAATQKWKATDEYVDHESGAKSDRRKFKLMLEAASKREFDVVLFWSLDRFSREGILPVLNTLKRLTDYGVKYRSTRSRISTRRTSGEISSRHSPPNWEVERQRIQSRVRAGLEKAKADGKTLGRPKKIINKAKVWSLGIRA